MINNTVYLLSLLDVLADRKDRSRVGGYVLINGERQPQNFKCASGYVVQVHMGIGVTLCVCVCVCVCLCVCGVCVYMCEGVSECFLTLCQSALPHEDPWATAISQLTLMTVTRLGSVCQAQDAA